MNSDIYTDNVATGQPVKLALNTAKSVRVMTVKNKLLWSIY